MQLKIYRIFHLHRCSHPHYMFLSWHISLISSFLIHCTAFTHSLYTERMGNSFYNSFNKISFTNIIIAVVLVTKVLSAIFVEHMLMDHWWRSPTLSIKVNISLWCDRTNQCNGCTICTFTHTCFFTKFLLLLHKNNKAGGVRAINLIALTRKKCQTHRTESPQLKLFNSTSLIPLTLCDLKWIYISRRLQNNTNGKQLSIME